MLIGKNKKDILDFLLYRWKILAECGALARIQKAYLEAAKQAGIQIPNTNTLLAIKPCEHIKLIREKIIEILPEAEFINIDYEAPGELQPSDFSELYINHQEICIQHIKNLMEKIGIK